MKRIRKAKDITSKHFYATVTLLLGIGLISLSQLFVFESTRYLQGLHGSHCSGANCFDATRDATEELLKIEKLKRNSVSSEFLQPSLNKKKFVVLILANPSNEKHLSRVLDQVLNFTRGKDIPVAVALKDPSMNTRYRHLLAQYPMKVIRNDEDDLYKYDISGALRNSFNRLGNFVQGFPWSSNLCPKLTVDNHINVMDVLESTRTFYQYNFTGASFKTQNSITFGTWAFNPLMQKFQKANNKNYGKDLPSSSKCSLYKFVQNSFKFLLHYYSEYKNVIIVDDRKKFSPNILSFFSYTSEIFDLDPSIYCVSASNPLHMTKSEANPEELIRVDHFEGGGATMVPFKVIQEVVGKYKEPFYDPKENYGYEHNGDPLIDLSLWLSWTRNRKLRGCVIPSVPRVCPVDEECNIPAVKTDMKSLIRYKYNIHLLSLVENVEALSYDQLPCNSDQPLKPKNSSLGLSIYVKMDGYDDDLTLHCIFRCFGIHHHNALKGSLDNVYTIYWKGQRIFILGLPYSRYGPTIVKGAPLLMVMLEPLSNESMVKILRHHDYPNLKNCNITGIPYALGDEKDVENNQFNDTSESATKIS